VVRPYSGRMSSGHAPGVTLPALRHSTGLTEKARPLSSPQSQRPGEYKTANGLGTLAFLPTAGGLAGWLAGCTD